MYAKHRSIVEEEKAVSYGIVAMCYKESNEMTPVRHSYNAYHRGEKFDMMRIGIEISNCV